MAAYARSASPGLSMTTQPEIIAYFSMEIALGPAVPTYLILVRREQLRLRSLRPGVFRCRAEPAIQIDRAGVSGALGSNHGTLLPGKASGAGDFEVSI